MQFLVAIMMLSIVTDVLYIDSRLKEQNKLLERQNEYLFKISEEIHEMNRKGEIKNESKT